MNLIDEMTMAQKKPDDKTPKFNVGDTVRVHFRIVEGEKEHLSIFSALPLLTMTAGTSESYMFASAPLLTLYQSGKDTEKCSTLFGLLFDYEKGLKTEETSVMKGILYSSDMDGVMDKRKVGPFGLLYSSTIKEGQKKYSSMWDFLFYYSSGVEKNEFGLGPFGLLYSHSGSAEEQERTSILYSILYESNKSADGKTKSWSLTPLFGVKKQNDELGIVLPRHTTVTFQTFLSNYRIDTGVNENCVTDLEVRLQTSEPFKPITTHFRCC